MRGEGKRGRREREGRARGKTGRAKEIPDNYLHFHQKPHQKRTCASRCTSSNLLSS